MSEQRLSQLDLCFVIDCTTSMEPFIDAAQRQAEAILTSLSGQASADMRFAVVGYRDHGHLPICDVVPFAGAQASAISRALRSLEAGANNNPDGAEAVFDGLVAAGELTWRESALRVLVLVGDAPPHGCGADAEPFPDRFAADPTGYTLLSMAASLEGRGIALFALGMIPSMHPQYDDVTSRAFFTLASSTGGISRSARDAQGAIDVLTEITKRAFGELELDRVVHALLTDVHNVSDDDALAPGAPAPAPAPAAMAEAAGLSTEDVARSIERLKRRKIVE